MNGNGSRTGQSYGATGLAGLNLGLNSTNSVNGFGYNGIGNGFGNSAGSNNTNSFGPNSNTNANQVTGAGNLLDNPDNYGSSFESNLMSGSFGSIDYLDLGGIGV